MGQVAQQSKDVHSGGWDSCSTNSAQKQNGCFAMFRLRQSSPRTKDVEGHYEHVEWFIEALISLISFKCQIIFSDLYSLSSMCHKKTG